MDKEKQKDRFIDFFRVERRRLIGYVRRWIEDTAERDGEDIVQDVAFNVFNKADVTDPIENLTAYVYQALRNRTIDLIRKKRSHVMSLDTEVNNETKVSLSDLILDSRYRPDKELEKKELRRRIFQTIDSLNDQDRAIILETEISGRSFRELSEQWKVPIGTLLARKSRALRKIRETLEMGQEFDNSLLRSDE
jgi:RNA polymerase sigma factor (sigma-70 family)